MYGALRKKTRTVTDLLRSRSERLVLAESCTGGRLAALFTEIPGASDLFCGSFVSYREASKTAWLGVDAKTLKRFSAVSPETANAMVRGALRKTREATIAGAVTGYLGPRGKRVGLVYLAVLRRGERRATVLKLEIGAVGGSAERARLHRREIAAEKLLSLLHAVLTRS
jgi:nicotinamide-nucleotide amidase